MMRLTKVAGIALLIAVCATGVVQAAAWDEVIDGNPGVIGGQWWYNGSGLSSVDIGGGNWALYMADFSATERGQIQRTRRIGDPQGVTLYARFMSKYATDSQALRLQIMDGEWGRLQMGWQNGTWSLLTGTGDSWAMPADTWTTIWMTLDGASKTWKLWLHDGSQWVLTSQGSASQIKEFVDLRFGSNSAGGIAETYLDFWYFHESGAYEPGDPNAPVPEPGSLMVMGSALAGFAGLALRRRG